MYGIVILWNITYKDITIVVLLCHIMTYHMHALFPIASHHTYDYTALVPCLLTIIYMCLGCSSSQ